MLLTPSSDAMYVMKRAFNSRINDVAGYIWQAQAQPGAYTRPQFSSTGAVSEAKTQTEHPLIPPETP